MSQSAPDCANPEGYTRCPQGCPAGQRSPNCPLGLPGPGWPCSPSAPDRRRIGPPSPGILPPARSGKPKFPALLSRPVGLARRQGLPALLGRQDPGRLPRRLFPVPLEGLGGLSLPGALPAPGAPEAPAALVPPPARQALVDPARLVARQALGWGRYPANRSPLYSRYIRYFPTPRPPRRRLQPAPGNEPPPAAPSSGSGPKW